MGCTLAPAVCDTLATLGEGALVVAGAVLAAVVAIKCVAMLARAITMPRF